MNISSSSFVHYHWNSHRHHFYKKLLLHKKVTMYKIFIQDVGQPVIKRGNNRTSNECFT